MSQFTDFRDPVAARKVLGRIADLAANQPHRKFMEICGGHTHSIYRHGLEELLPENVELVHGPGCPVCVIPMGRIDDAIHIASQPNVIFCCFGDMLRVPGGKSNLLEARAKGVDIRIVYSPMDVLSIAEREPNRDVVFLAVGFETTTPSTAVTILEASRRRLENYFVMSNHIRIIPAIKAILDSKDLQLDVFIGPGQVGTVIGNHPYAFVASEYQKPLVTAGFEPLDILESVMRLLEQKSSGRCEVENQYTRAVKDGGNPRAIDVIERVFEIRPHFEWRGLGSIAQSALKLRAEFASFDAELRYQVPGVKIADPKACQCGEVLRGAIRPWECKVFGTACTPETPIGTCMVSSEGACAAYYNYGRYNKAPRIPVRVG
ncbi:MAG: hydrogenase formation protein HypD [Ilumatobacteraceae bacterium]